MAFVKMVTIYASPEQMAHKGEIIQVPDSEAKELVDGGYATVPTTEEIEKVQGKIKELKVEAEKHVAQAIKQAAREVGLQEDKKLARGVRV